MVVLTDNCIVVAPIMGFSVPMIYYGTYIGVLLTGYYFDFVYNNNIADM